jgi:class 3 adenylate cyclase
MTGLCLAAIMKTDIGGSTPRFRALGESDLTALLVQHRELIGNVSAAHGGQIVKSAGDGFWILFPSATGAALAATAMQEELAQTQSNKGDDRFAMRIVVTLGDVLHEGGDIFGDAVNLAARIETVTPVDEIYISAAARLAVTDAEVRTTLVDAFALKGFVEPVPVYRIEPQHRTQIFTDQYIVWSDLRGFGGFSQNAPVAQVEIVLDMLLHLVGEVCRAFGGIIRFNVGDAHCMTFDDPDEALAAAQRLVKDWDTFNERVSACTIAVAVHKGSFNLFRSIAYGSDLNIAAQIVDAAHRRPSSVLVSESAQRDVDEGKWKGRLEPTDLELGKDHAAYGLKVFRLRLLPHDGI